MIAQARPQKIETSQFPLSLSLFPPSPLATTPIPNFLSPLSFSVNHSTLPPSLFFLSLRQDRKSFISSLVCGTLPLHRSTKHQLHFPLAYSLTPTPQSTKGEPPPSPPCHFTLIVVPSITPVVTHMLPLLSIRVDRLTLACSLLTDGSPTLLILSHSTSQ
jgi:hypothetical protein